MTLLSPPIDRTSTQSSSSVKELFWVLIFFVFILAVENILVYLWAWQLAGANTHYTLWGVYSIAMLLSGATAFVAGLIGFLFGIPHSGAVETSRRRVATEQETEAIGDTRNPKVPLARPPSSRRPRCEMSIAARACSGTQASKLSLIP
jgi:hypothetical protein